MGEDYAAIQRGRGLPVFGGGGGGGSLMTYGAGSVTTQRTAFKHVMASEPYRYTCYLKQVMTSVLHKDLLFLKHL